MTHENSFEYRAAIDKARARVLDANRYSQVDRYGLVALARKLYRQAWRDEQRRKALARRARKAMELAA